MFVGHFRESVRLIARYPPNNTRTNFLGLKFTSFQIIRNRNKWLQTGDFVRLFWAAHEASQAVEMFAIHNLKTGN